VRFEVRQKRGRSSLAGTSRENIVVVMSVPSDTVQVPKIRKFVKWPLIVTDRR
jgi:hypothetical protein